MMSSERDISEVTTPQKASGQRAAAGGSVYVAGLFTGWVRSIHEVAAVADVDATEVSKWSGVIQQQCTIRPPMLRPSSLPQA